MIRRFLERGQLPVTMLALAALALPVPAFGVAGGATGSGGGGGSSGGGFSGSPSSGSEGDGIAFLVVIAFMAVTVAVSLLLNYVTRVRRRRRAARFDRHAGAANLDDGYWDPAELRARVERCFNEVQQSWRDRDVEASRPFVSDSLYQRHRVQLDGLAKQHRVNRIEDLDLGEVTLVRLHNVTDDGEDRFVARVEFSARDWVEDAHTNEFVNGNKNSPTKFVQFWSFARDPGHGWVLDEIQQDEEGRYHMKSEFVNDDAGPRIYEQPPAPAGQAP